MNLAFCHSRSLQADFPRALDARRTIAGRTDWNARFVGRLSQRVFALVDGHEVLRVRRGRMPAIINKVA